MYAAFVLLAARSLRGRADRVLADAFADALRRASPPAFVAASTLRSLSAYRQGAARDRRGRGPRGGGGRARVRLGAGLPALATAFLADALVDRGRLAEATRGWTRDTGDDEEDAPARRAAARRAGRLALAAGDHAPGPTTC